MTTAEQQAADARELARLRAALAEAEERIKDLDMDARLAHGAADEAEERAAKAEALRSEWEQKAHGYHADRNDERTRAEAAEAKLAATEADRQKLQGALADLQEGMVLGLERAQEREAKERSTRKAVEAKLAEAEAKRGERERRILGLMAEVVEAKARAEALAKALGEIVRQVEPSQRWLACREALATAQAALAAWKDKP